VALSVLIGTSLATVMRFVKGANIVAILTLGQGNAGKKDACAIA
jgi:hypothetical protein